MKDVTIILRFDLSLGKMVYHCGSFAKMEYGVRYVLFSCRQI